MKTAAAVPIDSIGTFRSPSIPTAQEINAAHQLAVSAAENAVEGAIKCGQLLRSKMEDLAHGERQAWIEKNCSFGYSTARLYMTAAKQNAKGVAFTSLRHLYPSGKSSPRPIQLETPSEVANSLADLDPGQLENAILSAPETDYIAMTRIDLDVIYAWRNECELLSGYTQEINAALGRVLTVAELWLSRAI